MAATSSRYKEETICHSPTRCIGDTSDEPSNVSEGEDASPTSLKPVAGSDLSYIFPTGDDQVEDKVGAVFPLQQQVS